MIAELVGEWKPALVNGVSVGPYEVNSLGLVRRVRESSGGHRNVAVYTPRPKKDGYLYVVLGNIEVGVHRLVLEAFIGPAPEGLVGRHKDEDTENNRLDNLFYGPRRGGPKVGTD